MTRPPTDPRFADPLSGLYWQVEDDRSTFCARARYGIRSCSCLRMSRRLASFIIMRHWAPRTPMCSIAERRVLLTFADTACASTCRSRHRSHPCLGSRLCFAKDLAIALGLLGLALVIATCVLIGLGLRPLDVLRRGVADIRSGRR